MAHRVIWGLVLGLTVLTGCGSSGPGAVDVSGTVTWKGEPVDGGHIRFIPIAPTTGRVVGSHIVQGRYEVAGSNAVAIGPHRIEITWVRNLPLPPGADDAATPTEEVIPARYNTQSTLKLEIPADVSTLTQDFSLTP